MDEDHYEKQQRRGEQALAYLIVGWLMFAAMAVGYVMGRVW